MRKLMSNLIIIISGVLLLACGAFGGDLEPSKPPTEGGTMHTLNEIYELVASGGCVPQYQYWHEEVPYPAKTIHVGSGIVHSILLSFRHPYYSRYTQIELKDGDNVIGIFNLDGSEGGEPSRMFTLDIPYRSNLSIIAKLPIR